MSSFNQFQIKRQAHSLSRRDTNDFWNVFRHIPWEKRQPKSATWDVEHNPRQREPISEEAGESGSPIEHATTAPEQRYAQHAYRENGSTSKETDAQDMEPTERHDSQQYSGDTKVDSGEGLRSRAKTGSIKEPAAEQPGDEEKPKKEHRLFKNVQPKEPFTVRNQIQRTLLNSWINILLVLVPVGIVLGAIPNMNKTAIFAINFVAIVPLAAMLSFSTEEIALRTGETLGGLLNATFGNAVELIVAIMALAKGKHVIVQTSLIGSVLSNLLLVMGMCFFFGGLNRVEQFFNTTVAQTATSLLALAIASIIIPSAFEYLSPVKDQSQSASMSRGTAVILLIVYGAYLYFQLKTHHAVFSAESQKAPVIPKKHSLKEGAVGRAFVGPAGIMGAGVLRNGDNNERLHEQLQTTPEEEEEAEDPQLHFWVAFGTLAGSTVLIAFCAEFLVDGIDAVVSEAGISEEFLGLILLPIVGNAAEHATAVTVAIKDKMDLAIGVAVGSSMQVALFLIPLIVIIGWCMGDEKMDLSFDLFQVVVLFVSVLLVNYLIADGKSHWLEGMQLMCLYVIIATCCWWYPVDTNE